MSVRGGDLTGNRTARVQQLVGQFSRDEFVDMLHQRRRWQRVGAEAGRRALRLARQHPKAKELEADALEKAHVAEGDKIVRALGGKVVSFSQPRASKQTPGIPDRKYYFDRHATLWLFERSTFWWEAKAESGEQSPAQKDFQAMCELCGETYVLGPLEALTNHLVRLDLCTINPDGSLEPANRAERVANTHRRTDGERHTTSRRCDRRWLRSRRPDSYRSHKAARSTRGQQPTRLLDLGGLRPR